MLTSERFMQDAPLEEVSDGGDIKVYLALALRYWWVFAIAMAAAGGAAYLVGSSRTPLYNATAKVLVQSARVPGSFSAGDSEANRRSAEDFQDLLTTRPVIEAVADTMELATGSRSLGLIVTDSTRSIVNISVRHPDPQRAADVANALARESIDQVRRRQLAQIVQFQASLSEYGIEPDAALIAGQASTLSSLSIVEVAVPSTAPQSTGILRDVLLAIVLGFVFSWLIVALREYLDDRVRTPDELRTVTATRGIAGLSTIGSVVRHRGGSRRDSLIIDEDPPRALTDAYKFLQTNLQFAALGTSGLKSTLVTSAGPEEGKTTTAINLATSIAREGDSSVILVDTDLRRPSLHRAFDLHGRKGLTHLLLGTGTLDEVASPTEIEGLRVIPAGPLPPDPPRLLRSERMREVVAELEEAADFVFFDSSPLLAVTDPMLVASLVDAVLLVVDSSKTRREPVKMAFHMLLQADPQMIGAVLNKVTPRGKRGYGDYHYSQYGHGVNGSEGSGRGGRLITRALQKLRLKKPDANGTGGRVRKKEAAAD